MGENPAPGFMDGGAAPSSIGFRDSLVAPHSLWFKDNCEEPPATWLKDQGKLLCAFPLAVVH